MTFSGHLDHQNWLSISGVMVQIKFVTDRLQESRIFYDSQETQLLLSSLVPLPSPL